MKKKKQQKKEDKYPKGMVNHKDLCSGYNKGNWSNDNGYDSKPDKDFT